MKKLFVKLIVCVCCSSYPLVSCQETVQLSIQENLGNCGLEGPAVKVAKDVRGRVSVLDASNPDLWVIVSEQGIIGNPNPIYDGPDIVIPCNLPDSLKRQNLKVIFSGDLKEYKGTAKGWLSTLYNSELTSVKSR